MSSQWSAFRAAQSGMCRTGTAGWWNSLFFAALIHIRGPADCSMLLCCLASPYITLTANCLWCTHCCYVACRTVCRDLLQKAGFFENLSLFGLSWGKLWVFCSRKRTNVNSAYFNILSEFVLDLSPSTELCESISFPRPYSQYQSTDECVSLVQPEHLKKTHFSTLRSPLYNHSVSRSGSGDIMDSFIKINFRGQVDPLHLFFCSRTHCLQISVIIIYLSAGLVIIS